MYIYIYIYIYIYKFTYLAVVVTLKKKTSRFYLYLQDFSRSGKLLGKFQDLFTNSGLCAKTRRGGGGTKQSFISRGSALRSNH